MWHQQWKNRKILLLSTADWNELDEAVRLLRVPALMKQTRILAVSGPRGTKAGCSPEEVKKKLGAETGDNQERPGSANRRSIDLKAAKAEAEPGRQAVDDQ